MNLQTVKPRAKATTFRYPGGHSVRMWCVAYTDVPVSYAARSLDEALFFAARLRRDYLTRPLAPVL